MAWCQDMQYWLFKSEPDVFSFSDLKARGEVGEPWNGVRNYQARNYMRDAMSPGDLGLFYHSNCAVPGIAGVLRIATNAYPDQTQFDPASEYYDPTSSAENPRWQLVDVVWVADFPSFISLAQMREDAFLADMLVLRKGNRLSITPVAEEHFEYLCQCAGLPARR